MVLRRRIIPIATALLLAAALSFFWHQRSSYSPRSTAPIPSERKLSDATSSDQTTHTETLREETESRESRDDAYPNFSDLETQPNTSASDKATATKTASETTTRVEDLAAAKLLCAATRCGHVHASDGSHILGGGREVRITDIPPGRFRRELEALEVEARQHALRTLTAMTFNVTDTQWLHASREGGIYYACPVPEGIELLAAEGEGEPIAEAISPLSAVPVRHSRPGSSKVIYLDFNGHVVSGTIWNSSNGGNPYNCIAYDTDGDPSTFSDAELTAIVKVWERVAEDYAPFDVDVTTEQPASFGPTVGRVLITRNTDAGGTPCPSSGAGGVAYVNVFGGSTYATTYSPAFVYSNNLSNREDYIAEAASHEMGHNMGLSHDGTSSSSYYGGHGSGNTSWGPVMGTGYGRNVSQWSRGEYSGATNTQDDLAVIAGKVSYRTDDRGSTNATATALSVSGTSVSSSGIIERTGDVDVYSFTTNAGAVTLHIQPWLSGSNTRGGNLDVLAELRDSGNTVLASNNPASDTFADLSVSVAAGTYYLHISPVGAGNPLNTGYSTYGSLGQYTISGTIPGSGPSVNVTLSVSPASISETGGAAVVTATLSATHTQAVTVNLSFSGTAALTSDYTRSGTSIAIPAGSTTGTVTVNTTSDTLDEADETVVVDISSVTNAVENGTQSVTITITDDDAPPTASISAGAASINENGATTISATLSTPSSFDVTVPLLFSGSAGLIADYTRSGTFITVPAGSSTASITITAVDDPVDEPAETIIFDTGTFINATKAGTQQVTVTINDNDAPPLVTLAAAGSPFSENAGTATVTASLSVVSAFNVTITLGFTGSAGNPADYSRSATSITIAPGFTSGSITLTGVNDALVEGLENVIVDIASVTNGTESGTQQVTLNVLDDESPNQPPAVSSFTFSPAAPIVGDLVTFTVAASDPEGAIPTLLYDYKDGSTGSTGQHTYLVAGTYAVSVAVSDGVNSVTRTTTVVVGPAAGSGTGGGTGGSGGGSGPPNPLSGDTDGDGVSDADELADGTDPLDPGSFKKLPMSLLKLSGKVGFASSGRDSLSFTGILPDLPPLFDPDGAVVTINAGGAKTSFTLNAKGKGTGANGTFTLTLKPSVRNPVTRKVEFLGGSMIFKAALKNGTWAGLWFDEGMDPTVTEFGSKTMLIDIALKGKVYTVLADFAYISAANIGARFKR